MAGTNNSISTLLAQFLRLNNNALAILGSLNNATTSLGDSVVITQTNSDGTVSTFSVPSFGWFKAELNRLDNNTKALAGLGDTSAFLKMPDGTTKQIFAASATVDPPAIATMTTPATFQIKNNWFFESFLSPLLFVGIDVTGQVPVNMERAVTKRLILQTNTTEQKAWFDKNYSGRNDVDYLTLLGDLNTNSIGFFVDEDVVELPVAVMQYKGLFDVLNTSDQQITLTSGSGTITVKKRKYTLNKLTYTDITTGLTDTKVLKINDVVIIPADGTKYQIDSLDAAENTIVVTMLSGNTPIGVGVGVLSIYSEPYMTKVVQVGIGHDERQVLFLKPIEPTFNVAASAYSPGTAFWTNNLTINTTSGTTDLDTFYKGQVTDFGMQFIQGAKDRTVPSVYGEIPDAPVLDPANFQIVQTNAHITDQAEIDTIKTQLTTKTQLQNQIAQLDQSITATQNNINNNAATQSPAEKAQLQAQLVTLTTQRQSQSTLYASVVSSIATIATQNPASATPPEFRCRGFFPMPAAQTSDKTNPQEPVQFIIGYRKLAKSGNAPATQQINFVDTDGNTKSAYFSNWIEVVSPLRPKVYNPDTGFYEWAVVDPTIPDVVNINQVDIPTEAGEQIEIRVMTISEAGWPVNPLTSAWSASVIVDFPQDLQISSDISELLANAQAENTRVQLQNDLNSQGLAKHLSTGFTGLDQYYAHTPQSISSGFYTSTGAVISLFDQLTSMNNQLQQLQAIILKAKGTLVVYLLDDAGNITKVTQNQTVSLFAGFYKQLIQSGSGPPITYNNGQVVTKVYTLRLENSAASTLELASYMPGGVGQFLPASSTSIIDDYKNNRIYDQVPLSLSGLTNSTVNAGDPGQLAPWQSAQANSMWLYCREKSVGLEADLYEGADMDTSTGIPTAGYTFLGTTTSAWNFGNRVPLNGYHLLPYDPTSSVPSVTTDPGVWNGLTDASGNPLGGGYLSEFCINTSHPIPAGLGASWNYNLPVGTGATLFGTTTTGVAVGGKFPLNQVNSYPPFVHSMYFNDDISVAATGQKQLQFIQPVSTPIIVNQYGVTSGTTAYMTQWPAKLGFHKNDKYLIGKYTCGSYLYLAPVNYTVDVSVDGSTSLATKDLLFGEDKAINVPLVFQMRCSDILGYVGGYRSTGNISNITYTKKVGIDIQVQNETLFSFDVAVTGKYDQDSLVGPVYIPNMALDRLSSIRTTTQTQQVL